MKTCRNCGADEGLHHFETNQCPKNGREAPVGKPQLWSKTVWDDGKTEDDIETLQATIELLNTAIKNLMERVDDLEEDFFQHDDNRNIHND